MTTAREGRVTTGSGGIDRTCASCGKNDEFPRHVVSGVRVERQSATLPGGQTVPVDVPIDEAYHMECHADMGCEHCADMVEHNGGHMQIAGEEVQVPDHLLDLAPGEFAHDDRGVLTRQMSKEEARAAHDEAAAAAGFEVLDHDEAHALHLAHAAGETE